MSVEATDLEMEQADARAFRPQTTNAPLNNSPGMRRQKKTATVA